MKWNVRGNKFTKTTYYIFEYIYIISKILNSYTFQQNHISGTTPGFLAKASMGVTAGALGAFCGTPADVALIRMCVDNRLPEAQRRNYSSGNDPI